MSPRRQAVYYSPSVPRMNSAIAKPSTMQRQPSPRRPQIGYSTRRQVGYNSPSVPQMKPVIAKPSMTPLQVSSRPQLGYSTPSVPRVKSVIVKPPQTHFGAFRAVGQSASQHQSRAATTVESVIIEGQSGVEEKFIHIKVEGATKIDDLDALVTQEEIVSELLPRLRHSTIESLTIRNFRDGMKLDDDLMTKFCIIFRTVSVVKEAFITETWFGKEGKRCSLKRFMNCFKSFEPKSLDIWHSTGLKLDDLILQRFRDCDIRFVSLLHAEHAFTSRGVQDFFFAGCDGSKLGRTLDIGCGCNPIKRVAPNFVHFFIVASQFSENRGRVRLYAPVGEVDFDISAYKHHMAFELGASTIHLPGIGLTIELPRAGRQTVRIRRD